MFITINQLVNHGRIVRNLLLGYNFWHKFGAWRSPASALAWGVRGPGFESRRPDFGNHNFVISIAFKEIFLEKYSIYIAFVISIFLIDSCEPRSHINAVGY